MNDEMVTICLDRGGRISEYKLPFENGMNALSAIRTIYETLDRSVAYPTCLCRMGRCGACAIRLNGKAVLGCVAKLEPNQTYWIEPINDCKCIRDLVCG